MKQQRIASKAAAMLVGRVYDRADVGGQTRGYAPLQCIEDMYVQTLDCHAATELPNGGLPRWSRAALAVLSLKADRKAP